MGITNDFEKMVSDYFQVYGIIDKLAPKQFENLEFWDTDLTKLSVCSTGKMKKYDCIEAAKMFSISESSMQNFLVVHCCLSNNLNILVKGRKYESWRVKDNQLAVLFDDEASEYFDGNEIGELLCMSNKIGWSYTDLLNVENSLD